MSESTEKKKIAWSLWIPVIFAFLLVICAWTVLIKIASDNPVETIKLETKASPQTSGTEP